MFSSIFYFVFINQFTKSIYSSQSLPTETISSIQFFCLFFLIKPSFLCIPQSFYFCSLILNLSFYFFSIHLFVTSQSLYLFLLYLSSILLHFYFSSIYYLSISPLSNYISISPLSYYTSISPLSITFLLILYLLPFYLSSILLHFYISSFYNLSICYLSILARLTTGCSCQKLAKEGLLMMTRQSGSSSSGVGQLALQSFNPKTKS